jgi:hypothetical protein
LLLVIMVVVPRRKDIRSRCVRFALVDCCHLYLSLTLQYLDWLPNKHLLVYVMTPALRRCSIAAVVTCSGLGLFYVGTQAIANRRDALDLGHEVDWSVQALHGICGQSGLSSKQAEELFL